MKKKTIIICSSASFYRQALEVEKLLRKRGFRALVPFIAKRMKRSGNFEVSTYKTWYANSNDWNKKTALMKRHFKKVLEGDAVLVLNYRKNKTDGYIGGNVLMEMALAFHYKKPIFILHPVTAALPLYEEVMGVQPIFLNGDLRHLS
ncbi:MAG: hypothetical protein UY50_C0006G0050 [Parcubacteria group bacterium GW2011_GWA2_49_9]|nr:MAG: hypothetical protein UY50_C0006G0050 [Parcubacteria group bacterium GW2011_GWA2_49_9]